MMPEEKQKEGDTVAGENEEIDVDPSSTTTSSNSGVVDQVNLDSLDSSFTPFQNEEASLDVLLRVANQPVELTLDQLKDSFVEKKKSLDVELAIIGSLFTLFSEVRQIDGVWECGGVKSRCYEEVILCIKINAKKKIESYNLMLTDLSFVKGELKRRGGWESEFEVDWPAKLNLDEYDLSAAEFERLRVAVSTFGQSKSSTLSSSKSSSFTSPDSSSDGPCVSPFSALLSSPHAPVGSPILSPSQGGGGENPVKQEGGASVGVISDGFLRIQKRRSVVLPSLPLKPCSVHKWLCYEGELLCALELGEREGEDAVVELCKSYCL